MSMTMLGFLFCAALGITLPAIKKLETASAPSVTFLIPAPKSILFLLASDLRSMALSPLRIYVLPISDNLHEGRVPFNRCFTTSIGVQASRLHGHH
jgi:hypothetical protein